MDNSTKAHKQKQIGKDIRLSGIVSPFRVGLPILAYFFLYPIIIRRSGLSVLGLWSLIVTLSAYIGLANVGFSPLLIKAVGAAEGNADLSMIAREHFAAQRFYIVVTSLLLGIWIMVAGTLIDSFDAAAVYAPIPLVTAVAVYIISLGVAITAQLDAAILNGAHYTYATQVIDAFSPVILYSVALGGALLYRPIEGFALGALLAAFFQFFAYKLLLRKKFSSWQKQATVLSLSETVRTCAGLMQRGIHFYTISMGFILREPLFRALIAFTLGLSAAGVYEIATRVPAAIRELFVSGARSLLPAFSHYHTQGLFIELHNLIRQLIIIFVVFGHMALLTYAAGAPAFLDLWLPMVPRDLVSATRIMTLFCAITILNIPFWYLLQANGHEKVAARSLLYHTALILLLYPLAMVVKFSLQSMLWYWVVTSIVTQVSIYNAAEKTAGAVFPIFFSQQFILTFKRLFVIAMLLAATSLWIIRWALGSWATLALILATAGLLFFALLLPIAWPIVKTMIPSRIIQIFTGTHESSRS